MTKKLDDQALENIAGAGIVGVKRRSTVFDSSPTAKSVLPPTQPEDPIDNPVEEDPIGTDAGHDGPVDISFNQG